MISITFGMMQTLKVHSDDIFANRCVCEKKYICLARFQSHPSPLFSTPTSLSATKNRSSNRRNYLAWFFLIYIYPVRNATSQPPYFKNCADAETFQRQTSASLFSRVSLSSFFLSLFFRLFLFLRPCSNSRSVPFSFHILCLGMNFMCVIECGSPTKSFLLLFPLFTTVESSPRCFQDTVNLIMNTSGLEIFVGGDKNYFAV